MRSRSTNRSQQAGSPSYDISRRSFVPRSLVGATLLKRALTVPRMNTHKVLLALRWVILGPATLLVAFGAVLLVLTATSESGRPRAFGLEMFVVTSGSMTPGIDPGDVVMVNTKNPSPRVGDVITFQPGESPSVYVTHRVVEVARSEGTPIEYVTKGDANPSADLSLVTSDQVVGTVSSVVPWLGRLVFGLRDPRFVLTMGLSVLFAEWATALLRRVPRMQASQVQQ